MRNCSVGATSPGTLLCHTCLSNLHISSNSCQKLCDAFPDTSGSITGTNTSLPEERVSRRVRLTEAAGPSLPTRGFGPRRFDDPGRDLRLRDREHNAKVSTLSGNGCPLEQDDSLARDTW